MARAHADTQCFHPAAIIKQSSNDRGTSAASSEERHVSYARGSRRQLSDELFQRRDVLCPASKPLFAAECPEICIRSLPAIPKPRVCIDNPLFCA
ncbi:hypothetical protein VTN00DRAFT_1442 [Thermoascus crustaceus]|uniref:uncharacterized protein n=1 Tax=Thermoascus crustaceus TaxID=5088 RepID=UPI0037427616